MARTTVYVTLVVNGNPEVQFDRDIWGDSKMRWREADDSPDFDFVSISGLPEDVFETTRVSNKKINVKDKMNTGVYPYTITVRYQDTNGDWQTANSDMDAPNAEGGRPVIRN